MKDRFLTWLEEARRPRALAPLERLSGWVTALSPGDRLIAYVLLGLFAASSVLGIYALEQSLLVRVPIEGGSLVEGEVGSPRFVNPLLAISDSDRDLTALTYAGLMGLSGDGELVPVIAESYTISPDGKTYTFILRKNVQFSDGSSISANDVVFTVEKAQDAGLKSPEYADWSGVTVSALDARTVQFVLAKPYAPFLSDTTLGIMPARLWSSISDEQFPFSKLAVEPVAAGPFKVAGLTRGSTGLIESYTVVANPNYPLGRPYLDSVRINFYSSQTALGRALDNGSVENAYGIPGMEAGHAVHTAPYSRVFGVFFNPSANPLFARAEVRKALSLVIDRDTIVHDVLGGYATAIMGPVPPGSGITNAPVPTGVDPVASAAAVLQKAGWVYDGANRSWKNAGAKLTLSTLTIKTSNVPELKAIATEVKAAWERLGVATDVELYEPGDLNQNVIRPRKYDALLFGMVVGRGDDLYAFWDSSQRNDPGLNIAGYANKTVDALLEDARETGDEAVRRADLQKIEDAVASDYPAAFTHAPDFVYATARTLGGVTLPQISVPADRFSSVANWYLHTEAVWPFLITKN